jgi:uncharacterized protein DUF262
MTKEPDNPGPDQTELVFDPADGVEDLNEDKEVIPYNFEITAYGADYDVEGLVKRLQRGDIVIPTFDPEIEPTDSGVVGFQRRFVWRKTQCDRFIESLLLGLPVPGIFLVKEPNGVLLVLDGQQRLRTLEKFLEGFFNDKVFKLESVQERFEGLTYKDLADEDRRRLNDAIIHATVVRQDTPQNEQESVYLIFERLNTSGTTLQPQEVRSALYSGELAELIRTLNENEDWRAIFGPPSPRFKDHELIVRFFALLYYGDQYKRPMKVFLNRYMATNRNLESQSAGELQAIFEKTVSAFRKAKGDRIFRVPRNLNAAVFDAAMTGLARRIDEIDEVTDLDALAKAYDELVADETFLGAVERATADEDSVRTRLTKATQAFSSIS